MTDKEKAIIMAYTGVVMLKGDKIQIFYKYVEKIMGRPILTHEMARLATKIKEKSKDDFMALCKGSANECNLYNEKRGEIIEMLKMLKKAARYNDYNTLIEDVRLSSFNLMMDKVIKSLEAESKEKKNETTK